ncbi:Uncharacterized protein ACO02O_03026 [Dirofilaria immitis]
MKSSGPFASDDIENLEERRRKEEKRILLYCLDLTKQQQQQCSICGENEERQMLSCSNYGIALNAKNVRYAKNRIMRMR